MQTVMPDETTVSKITINHGRSVAINGIGIEH